MIHILDIVCKQLGVQLNKTWTANIGNVYKIDKNGNLLFWDDILNCWSNYNEGWAIVLTGELRPKNKL